MTIELMKNRCLAAVVICFGAMVGCGEDVENYDVSGKVTFKGQPVPAGKIYFIPDGAKGNSGAPGYANIQDGAYDTSAEGGKGAPPGPVLVGLEGYDPNQSAAPVKGDTSGEKLLVQLFPYYELTAEIPKESTTLDFEVPAEAGDRKSDGERPTTKSGKVYINP